MYTANKREKRKVSNVCMGFIMSKFYRGQTFSMLVLKPGNAKKHTVVDEFLRHTLSEYKVLFKYVGDSLIYHKVLCNGRGVSVLEMHDGEKGDMFWDCVQGMDGVAYFVESVNMYNTDKILQNICSIKETHALATLLIVVVSVKVPEEAYIQFRAQIKFFLKNRRYKIIDGEHISREPASTSYVPTKETICQGLFWVIQQVK